MNQVLLEVLLKLFGKTAAEVEAMAQDMDVDEDDPDASFATRQKVRVGKTILLFKDPSVDDPRQEVLEWFCNLRKKK